MEQAIQKVRSSIISLPDQCEQAWDQSRKVELPSQYKTAENIVVCGMGGSGLPVHFITSVFASRVPTTLVNGYDLPYWVRGKTLVLLSSYSGDTQETLSCAREAKEHECMVVGITSGGRLGKWLDENGYPMYLFDPIHNPANKPRLGLGYGIFGQLGILDKLEFIQPVGEGLLKVIPQEIARMRSNDSSIRQKAYEIAKKMKNQAILIFSADHLSGNAHIFANQLNETAKTFAAWFTLPEANHHLLEGLKHKSGELVAFFLLSSFFDQGLQKRFQLTMEVIKKNHIAFVEYKPRSDNLFGEALETLQFTSYLSLELAILHHEDPLQIPWVDWFKKQLENNT